MAVITLTSYEEYPDPPPVEETHRKWPLAI
eukprot:COSAG01_NODE_25276_length_750_cov_1.007680_1_plen_29_part_10